MACVDVLSWSSFEDLSTLKELQTVRGQVVMGKDRFGGFSFATLAEGADGGLAENVAFFTEGETEGFSKFTVSPPFLQVYRAVSSHLFSFL